MDVTNIVHDIVHVCVHVCACVCVCVRCMYVYMYVCVCEYAVARGTGTECVSGLVRLHGHLYKVRVQLIDVWTKA